MVVKVLRENYNAVLLGYYHVKEVRVNGEKVEPWKPAEVDKIHNVNIRIGRHSVKGFFIKAKVPVPRRISRDFYCGLWKNRS